MADQNRAKSEEGRPTEIAFHYIKGNFFRVVHVDGAWGGITPVRTIQMSVFNERSPIPQQIIHSLKEDGSLGEEKKEARVTKLGIIREVEVELVMSIPAAIAIRDWLTDKINTATDLEAKATQQET